MKIINRLNLYYLLFFSILLISLNLAYYLMVVSHNNALAKNIFENEKNIFFQLKNNDVGLMSSSLEIIVQDDNLKKIYLEKDREKLYNYSQPLFQTLKNEYGITHWYFILPNGTDFVRIHNKDIYGDLITRPSFEKSKKTKQIVADLELGKTAYALRVIRPYYNGDELIGYMELGEEINHFLMLLKNMTNNEFMLIADKKFINEKDWKSVQKVSELTRNWSINKNHLIIDQTTKENIGKECFAEENLEKIEEGETLVSVIKNIYGTFICGGFIITDSDGNHSGAILSYINVTNILTRNYYFIMIVTILFLINIFIINQFIAHSFSYPIKNLIGKINEISKGNLTTQLEKNKITEFQELTDSFNRILVSLKLAIKKTGITKEELGLDEAIRTKEKAEKRYKLLFDSSADAIMTLNPPTWKFTSGNPATIKIYGLKDEKELHELGPLDLSPKYQLDGKLSSEKAKEMIDIAMKKGSSYFEWMHKKKDGTEFPCTVLLSKIKTNGEAFLQATIRDISKEKSYLEKNEIFKKQFDASPNSMMLVNYENKKPKIISINKTFTKYYGYTEKEAIGQNPRMIQSGLQDKKFYKILWSQILDPKIGYWNGEITNKKKDGSLITVILTITSLFDEKKEIKYFMGNHIDIMEQKNIMSEIEKEITIKKTILDNMPECVKIIDDKGKLIYLNKSGMIEHNIANEKDAIGLDWIKTIVPNQQNEVKDKLNSCLKTGKNSNLDIRHTKNGSNREWCNLSFSVIRNGSEKIIGILIISTEIKKMKK